VTEAAVLPSEIEQLPDLQGYLKLASFGELETGEGFLHLSGWAEPCKHGRSTPPGSVGSRRRVT